MPHTRPFKHDCTKIYQCTERLANSYSTPKKVPCLNPNERKVNEKIKSDVSANTFHENREDQKAAISEYLDMQVRKIGVK